MKITDNDKKRFWDKVDKSGDCWEWTAYKDRYGTFKWNGKDHKAHRFSWILANNKDIPRGMCILHRCDNPGCVNPSHLFLGTQKDNIRDCWAKGRHDHRGEKHTHNKLTRDQVTLIKKKIAEKEFKRGDVITFCEQFGKRFGVTTRTLKSIYYGESWTHIKAGLNE